MEEKEYKKCSDCQLEKIITDFYKNKANKSGYESICKSCRKIRVKSWQSNNSERDKKRQKQWFSDNPSKKKSYDKNYRQNNKEKLKKSKSTDYSLNKEKYKFRNSNWRINNPQRFKELQKASCAMRRATKKGATPSWVDREEIKTIYFNCPKGYHVDHIIPLNNELVCGLHVPWNLQYLLAQDNLIKSNKF